MRLIRHLESLGTLAWIVLKVSESELIYPYASAHWRYGQDEMLATMNGWCPYELREIDDAEKRAEICDVGIDEVRKGVKAIMLAEVDVLTQSRRGAENEGESGNISGASPQTPKPDNLANPVEKETLRLCASALKTNWNLYHAAQEVPERHPRCHQEVLRRARHEVARRGLRVRHLFGGHDCTAGEPPQVRGGGERHADCGDQGADGRLFAVEYKGEHLRNAKDTLEKDAIGRLWAAKSGGKCLYATVYKSDGGFDVKGQLDKLFGGIK